MKVKRGFLHRLIRQCSAPVVGLGWVEELVCVSNPSLPPVYNCMLCEVQVGISLKLTH